MLSVSEGSFPKLRHPEPQAKDPFFALEFQPSRPAYFYTVTATVKNEAGNGFLCFKFFGTLQNANA
jgi:hypothetical protein